MSLRTEESFMTDETAEYRKKAERAAFVHKYGTMLYMVGDLALLGYLIVLFRTGEAALFGAVLGWINVLGLWSNLFVKGYPMYCALTALEDYYRQKADPTYRTNAAFVESAVREKYGVNLPLNLAADVWIVFFGIAGAFYLTVHHGLPVEFFLGLTASLVGFALVMYFLTRRKN